MWNYYGGVGSRQAPAPVLRDMTALARWIRQEFGWVLRSGAAPGADSAFELGAGYLSEIWVPWPKFPFANYADRDPYYLCVPDGAWLRVLEERAQDYHPAWERLSAGAQKLMVRNMAQLYGAGPDEPLSRVMIGYAEVKHGQWQGGTGQVFRAAQAENVPILNFWSKDCAHSLGYMQDQVQSLARATAS